MRISAFQITRGPIRLGGALGASLLALACSGLDSTQLGDGGYAPAQTPGEPATSNEPMDDGQPAPGTWYAVTTMVPTGDDYAGYLLGTTTLERRALTLVDSVEIGGGTAHSAGDGQLFIAPFETPTFVRYAVDANGRISESGRISFVNYASTIYLAPRQLQFVSRSRAYIPVVDQVLVFDPTELVILESIPVSLPDLDGIAPSLGNEFLRRGDLLFWTAVWQDFERDVALPATALVVFDIGTGRVTTSIKEGCAAGYWGARGTGDAFVFGTGARAAAMHALSAGARAPAPCLLEVPANGTTFADTIIPLEQLAGTSLAALGGPVRPGQATLRIFDPSALAIDAQSTSADVAFSNAWSWWYLDLTSRALTPIDSVNLSGGETYTFSAGDVSLISEDHVVDTTLFDITSASAAPTESITAPGSIYSTVRVR
jgi:hypothetical protein